MPATAWTCCTESLKHVISTSPSTSAGMDCLGRLKRSRTAFWFGCFNYLDTDTNIYIYLYMILVAINYIFIRCGYFLTANKMFLFVDCKYDKK